MDLAAAGGGGKERIKFGPAAAASAAARNQSDRDRRFGHAAWAARACVRIARSARARGARASRRAARRVGPARDGRTPEPRARTTTTPSMHAGGAGARATSAPGTRRRPRCPAGTSTAAARERRPQASRGGGRRFNRRGWRLRLVAIELPAGQCASTACEIAVAAAKLPGHVPAASQHEYEIDDHEGSGEAGSAAVTAASCPRGRGTTPSAANWATAHGSASARIRAYVRRRWSRGFRQESQRTDGARRRRAGGDHRGARPTPNAVSRPTRSGRPGPPASGPEP